MFVEHLPGFFVDFGEDVVMVMGTATGTATAIFDNGYSEAFDAAGQLPYLTMISTDVASLAINDAVTVRGVGYRVRGFEPDGQGITHVRIERQ